MTYLRIAQTASVTAFNFQSLLAAWRRYGGPGSLVGTFVVSKPLTAAQLRRLPLGLRRRLRQEIQA